MRLQASHVEFLDRFQLQVAGHDQLIRARLTVDGMVHDAVVAKPTTWREQAFYATALESYPDFAAKWLPALYGWMPVTESPYDEVTRGDCWLFLGDLCANYRAPCILDCKLGTRLHREDTADVKRQRMEQKARETTSGTLGARITGMRLQRDVNADPVIWSKDKCAAQINDINSFWDVLSNTFLSPLDDSQQRRHVACSLVAQLRELLNDIKTINAPMMRLCSSSVLLAYDAAAPTPVPTVKLIDFAQSDFFADMHNLSMPMSLPALEYGILKGLEAVAMAANKHV